MVSLKHLKQEEKKSWVEGTGKKRREGKHDRAIGLHVLFFPEHDQEKRNTQGWDPLLQGTSDKVFTPPSINSQKEPIENGKEHHERDILLILP